MILSWRTSYLLLRLCVAVVFVWWGIDVLLHPAAWVGLRILVPLVTLVREAHIDPQQAVYLLGILYLLVAASLMAGMFARFFGALGILLVTGLLVSYGFSRDSIVLIGLGGALLTIVTWPERRSFA